MGVSLNPASFVEGGGLWDNLNVRWVNPRFVSNWTYKGKSDKEVAAFVVDLIDLDDGQEMEPQAWSCGDGFAASKDDKTPAENGDYLIGPPALIKSSNLSLLMESIGVAVPDNMKVEVFEKLFKPQIASVFDGFEVHMIRKVVKREGLNTKKKINPKTGEPYADTGVPIVDSIIKYPWEKPKKAPPGATKGAAKPAAGKPAAGKAATPAATPGGGSAEDKALELIGKVIANYPDGVEKDQLLSDVYKLEKVPKMRNEIVKLIDTTDLLETKGEGVFSYDPETNMVYPDVTE